MGRERGNERKQHSTTTRVVSAATLTTAVVVAATATAPVDNGAADTNIVASQSSADLPTLAELARLDSDGLLEGVSPALRDAVERHSRQTDQADNIAEFGN